jgi:hypothetical protein
MESGALPSDGKRDEVKVHVGGWSFDALADFEGFMELSRWAFVAVVGAFMNRSVETIFICIYVI